MVYNVGFLADGLGSIFIFETKNCSLNLMTRVGVEFRDWFYVSSPVINRHMVEKSEFITISKSSEKENTIKMVEFMILDSALSKPV